MKTLVVTLAALVLFGCSGESFTGFTAGNPASADADSTPADGGLDAIPTNAAGGNGGVLEEDGGSTSNGSGGAIAATGGSTAVGSGGAANTGGSVACTLVTHTNGIGQTWQDCVPINTYDLNQAMRACEKSGAAHCTNNGSICGGTYVVCGYDEPRQSIYGGCWGYYGVYIAGFVSSVALNGGGSCPNANSETSRPWG